MQSIISESLDNAARTHSLSTLWNATADKQGEAMSVLRQGLALNGWRNIAITLVIGSMSIIACYQQLALHNYPTAVV